MESVTMLMEKLKAEAGEAIFERAVLLYQSGNIKPYSFSNKGNYSYRIKAIVNAGDAFGVNIRLDFSYSGFKTDHYCTCPAGGARLCEHATAVIYKFLADDLPKTNFRVVKPVQSQDGLAQLKLAAAAPTEPVAITYKVGGLDTVTESFKFTLSTPQREEAFCGQLVDCLGDINYSAAKREKLLNGLSGFDRLVICFLENKLSAKEPHAKSVLLPKTREVFQFIITLIQNNRAVSSNTGRPLQLGEPLKPQVYLDGIETCLKFTYDLTEFELLGFRDPDLNYVIRQDTLRLIDCSGLEKLPPEIMIAPEQLGEVLFEILPRLSEKIRLQMAAQFQSQHFQLEAPEIRLDFRYEPDRRRIICQPEVKLGAAVYCGQDCLRLLTADPEYRRSPADPRQWLTVNRQPLTVLYNFLKRHDFKFSAGTWLLTEEGSLLKFMLNGLQQLPPEWPVITDAAFAEFKIAPFKPEPYVKVDLTERIDWFDFEIYYNLGGATYTHREIMAMLRRTVGGNYLHAGDHWFYIEEPAKLELMEQTFFAGDGKAGPLRDQAYNLIFFRQLLREQGITVSGNTLYNRFETDISRAGLLETCPLPSGSRAELRPYQLEGFYWLRFLHKYRFGGILADDMGLGKTIQALTLIKSLPDQGPSLIVCPRSLIYNWAAEIDKFYPGTAFLVYHGIPEERAKFRAFFDAQEIIITTYDIVVNDSEALRDYVFHYCILDEAQHIKNRQTGRAKECKKIKARFRLVITGTPVENHLEDLWSLFDFLMPKYLEDLPQFKAKYVESLKKPNYQESLTVLKQKIAPFMLRRQKAAVLPELPPKMVIIRNVLFSKLQEDVYQTILKQVQQEILNAVAHFGLEKSRLTVLSALTKLRQLCDHPSLALPEIGAEADSGKMEALMEVINEAIDGGHKIVVFSQFVRMLKLIRAKLQKLGVNFVYLDGSTTDRMGRINCFNNTPEIPVFLISLKAGGVGINLTAADIVIHTDPWWNPMVEEQATDRVHRIGQQRQVMVYKLITLGTVEEKLIKLQERKRAIFDAVIQNNGNPVNSLTWEDIRELFEIKGEF
jgi:superfamily II DNA or RNA helicase